MIQIAIDIGGTFTDIVCLENGARLHIAKVSTTPRALMEGLSEGISTILKVTERTPDDVSRVIHSTTIATNAILEKKGAVTGILMTEGFEDALEIGRQKRSDMYNMFLDAETPIFLAPRRLRVGIPERLDATGKVLKPLDEEALLKQVRHLQERHGVESLAVCYLFSFLNPAHEERTRELIARHFPTLSVSVSSELNPVFREYERVVITAFDAYVRPLVATYMGQLESNLERMGIAATVHVMHSRGGLTTVNTAIEKPVSMLLSGPAAGVRGACFAGERSGLKDLITLDIGGTSCDVALVQEGKPLISQEGRIRHYPLRLSMVDVSTVGAGGGSIAWVDSAGGLKVGPESAGADPGPICYGKGGRLPTVTDASLLLGYLNPATFAGGQMPLETAAAQEAMTEMGKRIGLAPLALAAGIHRIINERMADEVRLVSVRRGHDPRRFALVALGGAGPVHAGRLAALLAMPTIVVPATPGVLSAFGLLVAAIEHEHSRTFAARAEDVSPQDAESVFESLDLLGQQKMQRDRVASGDVVVERFGDLRYVGQSYELEVPLSGKINAAGLADAVALFHVLHERVYGHARPGNPVEFMNLRTVHKAAFPEPKLEPPAPGNSLAEARKETRPAYFEESGGFVDTPVYERARLPTEIQILGPAIVEQVDTTTVVYPEQSGRVDSGGNLLITIS